MSQISGIWHVNPFDNLKAIGQHLEINPQNTEIRPTQQIRSNNITSYIIKAIKIGFGPLPKYLLFRNTGQIEVSALALNKDQFESQKIIFLKTKPRIIDLDYHRLGFLASSNNKGKIFIYENQNFSAGTIELDFTFNCCFHVEITNSCVYNWSIVRFDDLNGLTNDVCSISNNSKKVSIYDFENKQARLLGQKISLDFFPKSIVAFNKYTIVLSEI